MPLLDYGSTFDETGIDGKKPQSWDNYVMPYLQTVRTLTNTTKFDYLNIQDDGLRTGNLRTHANVEAVRIKVRNATGSSIAAGSLVYFSGTYSDGTDSYPTITKAVTTTAVGTTFFAQATTTAAIGNGADGTAAIFLELTGQDTSGGTAGDSIYLDTTAGGWTRTRPTGGQYVQVVGTITVVHASTGRVVLSLGSVPEHLTGGSSGLGATFQTLTIQGASGAAADVYHISDAGEDNADKWKISVADGGNRTWENYTSGSYAAKLTLTSAGALTVAGALNIGSVSAAGSDTDKFLVLDGSGNVDYRTGAEVLSDIGASAVAGSSSIVTTGALDSGSITSGFGTIDTGSSTITTTGALAAGATTISGDTVVANGYGLIVGNTAQVATNTLTGEVQVQGTVNNDSLLSISRYSADGSPPLLHFAKSRNATIGNVTGAVQSGDDLGNIVFCGSDGTDFNNLSASIGAVVSGSVSGDTVPGALIFGTNNSERVRIDPSGRLGVHNASPSTVDGNTDVIVVGDGNANADVIMYAPTDGNGVLGWTDTANTTNQGYVSYLHDGDHLVFGTAAAARMRVNATGVGIGTDSPHGVLDIHTGTTDLNLMFKVTSSRMNMSAHNDANNANAPMSYSASSHFFTGGNVGIAMIPGGSHELDVTGTAGLSTGTAWTNTSDARIKKDVATITGATDKLKRLRPVSYKYTDQYLSVHSEIDESKTYHSFIADEYATVFPDAVSMQGDLIKVTPEVEAVVAQDAVLYVEEDEIPDGKSVGDVRIPAVEAVEAAEEVRETLLTDLKQYTPHDLQMFLTAAVQELDARIAALEAA
jgi:hypothetical protein